MLTISTPPKRHRQTVPAGFMTVTQAAKKWKVSVGAVRGWLGRDLIPGAVKLGPRAWMIPEGAVKPALPMGRPRKEK